MARLATAADFEGQMPDSLYTLYERFPFFAWRADYVDRLWDRLKRRGTLAASLTRAQTKIAVAGAAYGYLVEELTARGFDAWGFDASAYAIGKMQTSVNLTTRGRVLQKDLLVSSQVTDVRRAAGLTGQNRFHLGITEDVLPVMSDAEIAQAIGVARSASLALLHIVTAHQDTSVHIAPLNWKTLDGWVQSLTPTNGSMPDWLLDAEGVGPPGYPTDLAELARFERSPDGWVEPA